MKNIRLALAGSATALAIVAMLGTPAFASDAPTIGDLDQLSTTELEVLCSDTPKKIQIDPDPAAHGLLVDLERHTPASGVHRRICPTLRTSTSPNRTHTSAGCAERSS